MPRLPVPAGWMTPTTLQPDGQLHPHMRKFVEFLAGSPATTPEKWAEFITKVCQTTDKEARADELDRIRSVTLDADVDVWSMEDSGQLISLIERLKQLKA